MRVLALFAFLVAAQTLGAVDFRSFDERFMETTRAALPSRDLGFIQGDLFSDRKTPNNHERCWNDFSFGVSPGLMFDPVGFSMTLDMDIWALPFLSFGPVLQLGVNEDTFFLGFVSAVKGSFVIRRFERIVPFAWAGLGFCYVSRNKSDVDGASSQLGFLLSFGTGADFHLIRNFSLGTGVIFNFLVNEPAGERFIFMLELVRARFYF